jgi:small ligand-binding sensory domain FIST
VNAHVASASSEHPSAQSAVGEIVGELLDRVGPAPDLLVLFVTGAHLPAVNDIASTLRRLLNPRVLVGTTAVSVLGGAREIEEAPGISCLAARFGCDIEPVRLEAFRTPDGNLTMAGGGVLAANTGVLLLFADPFSFPAQEFLDHINAALPGLTVIGGNASAANRPGGNQLLLDGEHFDTGAVGVWLPPVVDVATVVSQGCRPIGTPFVVTAADGPVVSTIAGLPAMERLQKTAAELDPEEQELLGNGVHLGVVIDEHAVDFDRGDFLVRNIMGTDGDGGLVVGDELAIGTTVQFHVRDAVTAAEDLSAALSPWNADAALVFTCNGRGQRLFGHQHHDAAAAADELETPIIAGMFCAGEFGPVGGQNFLHGFTASVLILGPREAPVVSEP